MGRSQMEIMGLVIVVILLTLALLVVVQFVVLKKPSEVRKVQTDAQLAANLLNSVLQTTTPCKKYQIRTLLQQCVSGNDMVCGGVSACTYANRTIGYLLNDTLNAWGKMYNFSVSETATAFNPPYGVQFTRGDCSGVKEHRVSPVPAGGRTFLVSLDICRSS
jgi:hypothetical protein